MNKSLRPDSADTSFDETQFFPKGAIAFFVSMIVFFVIIWLGIYGLMILRKYGI